MMKLHADMFCEYYEMLNALVKKDFELRKALPKGKHHYGKIILDFDKGHQYSHFVMDGIYVEVFYTWDTGYDHDTYDSYTIPLTWFEDYSVEKFNKKFNVK